MLLWQHQYTPYDAPAVASSQPCALLHCKTCLIAACMCISMMLITEAMWRCYEVFVEREYPSWSQDIPSQQKLHVCACCAYVTGFRKTDLMGNIVDLSYDPKYTLDRHTMVFQIITLQKNTILCLPPGAGAMLIRACTCPGEAFVLVHSFCHWLRVTEKCSHDANVTMATVVAQRPSVCFS